MNSSEQRLEEGDAVYFVDNDMERAANSGLRIRKAFFVRGYTIPDKPYWYCVLTAPIRDSQSSIPDVLISKRADYLFTAQHLGILLEHIGESNNEELTLEAALQDPRIHDDLAHVIGQTVFARGFKNA
jgi:hypothetical protein